MANYISIISQALCSSEFLSLRICQGYSFTTDVIWSQSSDFSSSIEQFSSRCGKFLTWIENSLVSKRRFLWRSLSTLTKYFTTHIMPKNMAIYRRSRQTAAIPNVFRSSLYLSNHPTSYISSFVHSTTAYKKKLVELLSRTYLQACSYSTKVETDVWFYATVVLFAPAPLGISKLSGVMPSIAAVTLIYLIFGIVMISSLKPIFSLH